MTIVAATFATSVTLMQFTRMGLSPWNEMWNLLWQIRNLCLFGRRAIMIFPYIQMQSFSQLCSCVASCTFWGIGGNQRNRYRNHMLSCLVLSATSINQSIRSQKILSKAGREQRNFLDSKQGKIYEKINRDRMVW